MIEFLQFFPLVRFDCQTGRIICQQTLTLDAVTAALKAQYNIDAQRLLQRIFHAIDTLSRFPSSEYLLRGDGNAASPIKVYEKCANS